MWVNEKGDEREYPVDNFCNYTNDDILRRMESTENLRDVYKKHRNTKGKFVGHRKSKSYKKNQSSNEDKQYSNKDKKKGKKPCPPGQKRYSRTGRCRKTKSSKRQSGGGKTKSGKECKLCKKYKKPCRFHKDNTVTSKDIKYDTIEKGRLTSVEELLKLPEEELQEIFRNKKILSINGCFCPPHAGHYNMVDDSIKYIKPDIVIINSTNSKEIDNARHGTPLAHTKETWEFWGYILSKKHNVDVYFTDISNTYLAMHIKAPYKYIDSYIETNVWEKKMPDKYIDNPLERQTLEEKSLGFLYKVPRDFPNYYIYNIERREGLSATKFTKCLKNLSKDCLKYVPNDIINKRDYIENIRNNYGNMLK